MNTNTALKFDNDISNTLEQIVKEFKSTIQKLVTTSNHRAVMLAPPVRTTVSAE